jgi:hypothetical protein
MVCWHCARNGVCDTNKVQSGISSASPMMEPFEEYRNLEHTGRKSRALDGASCDGIFSSCPYIYHNVGSVVFSHVILLMSSVVV